jgi:hypothetical protein
MPEIRVHGLVRLMRWASAQLAAGIAPERAASFHASIIEAIQQVDHLLRQNRLSPSKLPRPSFEAYQFLKSVDLTKLPPSRPAPRRQKTPIGLSLAIQDEMLERLPALRAGESGVQDKLLSLIQTYRRGIQSACRKRGLEIQDLGAPSQRAAAWLIFLCEAETLALHLHALERLDRLARQALKKDGAVRVTFTNMTHLYRMDRHAGGVELMVHEGFIGAPDEVLEALAGAALSRRTARRMQLVRAYAAGADFTRLSLQLESNGSAAQPAPVGGSHHHLERAFERVNRLYFAGSLPRPALTWSRRATYREFGHYQPSSDTVSISRSLDAPSVPEYVLDYVVFHELLHKKLGMKTAGGRQYAHTPEFHHEEKRFERYAEAKVFLQEYSRRLSPHGKSVSHQNFVD